MELSSLQPKHGNKKGKRVGRGGKRGTTSGKGTKGQKSRSGHNIRPAERDVIKRLPKLRGHGKNRSEGAKVVFAPVNVGALEAAFVHGETVSPKALLEKGLVQKSGGSLPPIKLLGEGAITKKLVVEGCKVSASAKEKIEKSGGIIHAS